MDAEKPSTFPSIDPKFLNGDGILNALYLPLSVEPLPEISGGDAVHMMMSAMRQMIVAIGEDPDRPGLIDTPFRVARAWLEELFIGYYEDPSDYMTTFDGEDYDQLIAVHDIAFTSFCEHHALPFTGVAHVGYIPRDKIIGLSKIPRIVRTFSRRLQVQERMTMQIAEALEERLNPLGTIVVVKAIHSCMAIRGIQSPGTETTTSAIRGVFLDPTKGAREEFLELIK